MSAPDFFALALRVALPIYPMSTFLGGATQASVQSAADGSYAIDASYFNESGRTSGFSVNLSVNDPKNIRLKATQRVTSYADFRDLRLLSSTGTLITCDVTQ